MRLASIYLIITLLAITFASTPMAQAYNTYRGVDCSGKAASSAICVEERDQRNPIFGDDGILLKIADIVAYFAGAIAVIMILVGSFRFITAGSDVSKSGNPDNDVDNARSTIVNALIGLAVIILARTIINYVVTRL